MDHDNNCCCHSEKHHPSSPWAPRINTFSQTFSLSEKTMIFYYYFFIFFSLLFVDVYHDKKTLEVEKQRFRQRRSIGAFVALVITKDGKFKTSCAKIKRAHTNLNKIICMHAFLTWALIPNSRTQKLLEHLTPILTVN
jgi:hypothetical protein